MLHCGGCGALRGRGATRCFHCGMRFSDGPLDEQTPPVSIRVDRSRTRGGVTSFGLVGRIVLSLPVLLAWAHAATMMWGAFSEREVVGAVWLVWFGMVTLLGSVWLAHVWAAEAVRPARPGPDSRGGRSR